MADLSTDYLGLRLKNPVIAGASVLTLKMETVKRIEEEGAAALVVSSLFEEQIQLEKFRLEEDLEKIKYRYPEMIELFPEIEHAGPAEHLMWVKRVKESVKIPVIASLNAVNKSTWIEYAKKLEETGVDALELNFYYTPSGFDKTGSQVEEEQIEVLKEIKSQVKIPVSVKLSFFYSNPLNFMKRIDEVGADGIVIFNKLFQPDIDIDKEEHIAPFNLSNEGDGRLSLRFAGLLYNSINAGICANTGIHKYEDLVKMILAGANCVQVVSTLIRNGISQLGRLIKGLETWMEEKGYTRIEDFRGKLSKLNTKDSFVYARAQYVKLLLRSDLVLRNFPTV